MLEALFISQAVLWVLVLAMAGLQLALLRQIGVLHERIAPMGALTLDKGPKEGEAAPQFDLIDLGRRAVKLGGANPRGKSTLVFFLSPTCPVVKKMLPILRSMGATEARWLEIVLASDGEREEHERFIARQDASEPSPPMARMLRGGGGRGGGARARRPTAGRGRLPACPAERLRGRW